ncbi:MAG: hypothetical protein AAB556_02720 [Patescibacteria group bacterium]|mgnify:CR=1 FL=1
MEIPEHLSFSGREGRKKLEFLQRRVEFLERKIGEKEVILTENGRLSNSLQKKFDLDRRELSALNWAIEKILEYDSFMTGKFKRFLLHWKNGTSQEVEGLNITHACQRVGISFPQKRIVSFEEIQ